MAEDLFRDTDQPIDHFLLLGRLDNVHDVDARVEIGYHLIGELLVVDIGDDHLDGQLLALEFAVRQLVKNGRKHTRVVVQIGHLLLKRECAPVVEPGEYRRQRLN